MFILIMLMILADGTQMAVYPKPFASLEQCQSALVATVKQAEAQQKGVTPLPEFKCLPW